MPLSIEKQERTRWCWAAVAVSIESLYEGSTAHDQCGLAGLVLDRGCCAGVDCNRPWYLDYALRAVGHLRSMIVDVASVDELEAELDAGRVTGVLVSWRGGGGHFVAVSGVRRSPQGAWLLIADPRDGSRTELLATRFASQYLGSGRWKATYWTRP